MPNRLNKQIGCNPLVVFQIIGFIFANSVKHCWKIDLQKHMEMWNSGFIKHLNAKDLNLLKAGKKNKCLELRSVLSSTAAFCVFCFSIFFFASLQIST